MKKILTSALALAALGAASVASPAQTNTSASNSPSPVINRSGAPIDADRIIRTMAQKET